MILALKLLCYACSGHYTKPFFQLISWRKMVFQFAGYNSMVRRTDLHMNIGHRLGVFLLFATVFLAKIFFPVDCLFAEESVCAKVKIEIKQEMTFERQAFDAHMQINNGLTTLALENIKVDVLFSNEEGEPVLASSDPDDPEPLFFIRIASMAGIDDVGGSGTITAATTGDIHWLIIPAPASVEDAPTGALYFVGARLSYDLGGEEHVTIVTPDFITVRPLPLLSLDYFLPDEVYGDDPFTVAEEPSIPFSLGVRITNNGHGIAADVKIDSAQPKIVDNEQGLMVDFIIEGSEVNGVAAPDTLLIRFGDIPPDSSIIGRWLMSCSLSGRFTEFKAEYSHSNELGGELTSLFEDVQTHFLVQDVLVDAPGRDNIRDFLGRDQDLLKVYESDAGVTDVADLSAQTQVTLLSDYGGIAKYSVEAPPTAGFFYLRFTDPQNGNKIVSEIVRDDGKILKKENCWLSKKRVDADWSFYAGIFDYNSSGSYILTLIDPSLAPQPPSFEEQPNPVHKEGEEVSFIISLIDNSEPESADFKMLSVSMMGARSADNRDAAECDGKTEIKVGRLPVGAKLIDRCDGTAILIWTPQEGQAGDYPLTFTAIDGEFKTTIRFHLTITDVANTPTARFSADTISGEAPLTVVFTDESLSEDGISSWFWDFGDGSTSAEQLPTHIYDVAGIYPVSLTVTEIDGDSHTTILTDYITVDDGVVITPDMDSDNDGFRDELEIWHGYDPADAQNFPTSPIMEFGRVTVTGGWQTVRLNTRYLDPVVVATITETSDEVSHVKICNILSESFEILTTATDEEEVSYIVMERSRYHLPDGTAIIAGFTETAPVDRKVKYEFDTEFEVSPVVMVSLASTNDPGVASVILHKVKKKIFVFSLQTDKSNRKSTVIERIGFIAWQPSIGVAGEFAFETGYLDHINNWWQEYKFSSPLYGIQALVAVSQKKMKGQHKNVFFRNLGWSGIEARIRKNATKRSKHHGPNRSVGFIALSFIPLDLDTDGDTITDRDEIQIYGTDPTVADSDGDGIDDGAEAARWGENWAGDEDNDGLVNILDIDSDNDGYNDGLEFMHGFNPADALDLPDGPVMGFGDIAVDSQWQTVSFSREYLDPVVVALPGMQTFTRAVISIRDVVSTGFEIRGVDNIISYMVMERGIYTLPDGEQVIADHSTTGDGSMSAYHPFSVFFETAPVVMASLVSGSESAPASVCLLAVSRHMFYSGLYDDAGYTYSNDRAGLDYIAWEPSAGQTESMYFHVDRLRKIDRKWRNYKFKQYFPMPPDLMAMSQRFGRLPADAILARNITETDVDIRIAPYFESRRFLWIPRSVIGVIAIGSK